MYLRTLDQEITDIQSNVTTLMQNVPYYESRLVTLEKCQKEFLRFAAEIISEAQIVFFQERMSLIQTVLALVQSY